LGREGRRERERQREGERERGREREGGRERRRRERGKGGMGKFIFKSARISLRHQRSLLFRCKSEPCHFLSLGLHMHEVFSSL
jgi:hypothetical protein